LAWIFEEDREGVSEVLEKEVISTSNLIIDVVSKNKMPLHINLL